MRAVLKLELIGDDYFYAKRHNTWSFDKILRYMRRLGPNKSPSWLAEIVGFDAKGNLNRQFIQGQKDYSEANSTGSRGIFVYYALPSGIYEVNDRHHWRKVRHYFCRVEGTQITEINQDEVIECLKSVILP